MKKLFEILDKTLDDTIKKEHYSNCVSTEMTIAALDWMEEMVMEEANKLSPGRPPGNWMILRGIRERIEEERG